MLGGGAAGKAYNVVILIMKRSCKDLYECCRTF